MGMERRKYVKTRLEHWNDISMLNPRFLKGFVFRGQGNSNWRIKSSLERLIERFYLTDIQNKVYPSGFETEMLREFQWKYPNYETANIPKENEVIEWLSIMQHYGSCTRMVDFTFSPYVALFMAIDSSEGDNAFTIWCLNHLTLSEIFSEDHNTERVNLLFDNPNSKSSIYNYVNQILIDSVNDFRREFRPYVYLVKPCKANKRIVEQQGLFAIPERIDISFEKNLFALVNAKETEFVEFKDIIEYSYSGKFISSEDYLLIKIDIPAKFRYEISQSLYLMNMTAESLYPGLPGLAKSLNYQRLV